MWLHYIHSMQSHCFYGRFSDQWHFRSFREQWEKKIGVRREFSNHFVRESIALKTGCHCLQVPGATQFSTGFYWLRHPLQYSCLENPVDGRAWKAAVHGVAEGRTRLSNFTFTFHFHALEKETATHCSVIAWRIPGMGEPGGLPSMVSHWVGHDWSALAAARWM